MKENVAQSLKASVEEYLQWLNNPDVRRSYDQRPETFSLIGIYPLSDHSASVAFLKETSRKKMISFFYYLPSSDRWYKFVPTDPHVLGFALFAMKKLDIEKDNFEISIAEKEIDPDQKRFLEEMRKKAEEEVKEADDEVPF